MNPKAILELKKQAGYRAIDEHVTSGMVIGLGTGSTSYFAVERVGQKLASGELKDILAVPTSQRTEDQAKSLGIPLTSLDENSVLDVAVDGADTVDGNLFLVKGGGGALLREKLVEVAAKKFVVIVDESKLADGLGKAFAIPVEIIQFNHQHIKRKIEGLPSLTGNCEARLRLSKPAPGAEKADPAAAAPADGVDAVAPSRGQPYVTENGNYIVDLHCSVPLWDPQAAAREIRGVVGVVEHGLFLNMATEVIVAGSGGVTVKAGPR